MAFFHLRLPNIMRGASLAIAVVMLLTACSQQRQSLFDYISAICASPLSGAPREEAPFLEENISAMSKMMIDMGIAPSGDVDRDFVAMMVPHHQGAIDMARAELRYGRNERLRRMAQEIIVTQRQEIGAMRLAIGEPRQSLSQSVFLMRDNYRNEIESQDELSNRNGAGLW